MNSRVASNFSPSSAGRRLQAAWLPPRRLTGLKAGRSPSRGHTRWPGPATDRRLLRQLHRLLEVLIELVEELSGGQPGLVRADQDGQVLGHEAGFDRLDAHLFQRLGEMRDVGGVVELGAIDQAAGPGEDRRDRVE